ncbi:hypothetical protein D7N47_15500 [Salmonella enterica subsp. enterica]|nr:hypothetical protein [Salmonella enterica subsp. enterica serovar Richmond]EAU4929767.1 hypothetical protein [Salmonella enterica]
MLLIMDAYIQMKLIMNPAIWRGFCRLRDRDIKDCNCKTDSQHDSHKHIYYLLFSAGFFEWFHRVTVMAVLSLWANQSPTVRAWFQKVCFCLFIYWFTHIHLHLMWLLLAI